MRNPLIKADFPDPDVIRVGDTYYMASTTMHFMPGCVLLRSYNLVDWEIVTHVYDTLADTEEENLDNGKCAYGQGMWAPSLRYHNGMFYICFVANDTKTTYLYTSTNVEGTWEKKEIEGFYHDMSLLFDEGKVYIAYGNKEIHIQELKEDLSAPKEGGLHKIVVRDESPVRLGYEGTHFYKINGKYYLFFIHWPLEEGSMRTEACYVADSIEGPYIGGDVLSDDCGYCNQGVAQGGIVDTPDGDWYAVLFQDSGAVGRIPVLVPVTWKEDYPVFGVNGKVPKEIGVKDNRPGYLYTPIYGDDDFEWNEEKKLLPFWQWNHNPKADKWGLKKDGGLWIQTDNICQNVTQAHNTLTQRLMYPGSSITVHVEGSSLKDGDRAGLCLLQADYVELAVEKEGEEYFTVLRKRSEETINAMCLPADTGVGEILFKMSVSDTSITIGLKTDFVNMRDKAQFYVIKDGIWKKIGPEVSMYFKLNHFCGCRIGLFCYGTKESGGIGEFANFTHNV